MITLCLPQVLLNLPPACLELPSDTGGYVIRHDWTLEKWNGNKIY